jgi:hypothetical protein
MVPAEELNKVQAQLQSFITNFEAASVGLVGSTERLLQQVTPAKLASATILPELSIPISPSVLEVSLAACDSSAIYIICQSPVEPEQQAENVTVAETLSSWSILNHIYHRTSPT